MRGAHGYNESWRTVCAKQYGLARMIVRDRRTWKPEPQWLI
jgi:hypothetical protein